MERLKSIPRNKMCFIDIEADFRRKMLSLGITDYKNTFDQEYFFWQDKSKLYYPENVDLVYLNVLVKWEAEIMKGNVTKIKDCVAHLVELSKEGYIYLGWNIRSYDLNILKKYAKKYLDIDWEPVYFDMYIELKQYYKKYPKKRKTENLRANTIWQWLTQTHLNEEHMALSDAELERHIFKLLNAKYGKDLIPNLVA